MTDFDLFTNKSEPNLPPAGFKRDEELKIRADNLEERGEKQYADMGTIPPEALQPDHNIQNEISKNYLEIGVNHPLYITKWVNYVNQNALMVWQSKSDGWMVASVKEFPEAKDVAKVDGTIRVGDVILMFIPKDQHLQLQIRERNKRLKQQLGIEADIHDLAESVNRSQGREVFANVQTPAVTGGMPADRLASVQRKAAVSTAARAIGNKMKKGVIPGVPIK